MDTLIIRGGKRLSGEVTVSSSKNSILPIMAATLLTEETCVIHNTPMLSDVMTMMKILEDLGKKVELDGVKMTVKHVSSDPVSASYDLVKTMRASVCVLGPLLGARTKAKVSMPGGCVIGLRPIDIHLRGFEALGAEIRVESGYCVCDAAKGLVGREIYLGGHFGSSVLGTGNIMMAAALAKGRTVIDFAACEPEVADLANVLIKMGAKITGGGSPQVVIDGVKQLKGFEHHVIPDRIEAGTYMVFGLITGGDITLKNVVPQHLGAPIDTLRTMGHTVECDKDSIRCKFNPNAKAENITTLTFPGFPTDLQAQFMALLTQTQGVSVVTEKIYPDRFMHVAELNRLGAGIFRSGEVAIIDGKKRLSGADVMASDLRASACLVAAGLAAEGTTTIHRLYHLDRGYEMLVEKVKALGGDLERAKENPGAKCAE